MTLSITELFELGEEITDAFDESRDVYVEVEYMHVMKAVEEDGEILAPEIRGVRFWTSPVLDSSHLLFEMFPLEVPLNLIIGIELKVKKTFKFSMKYTVAIDIEVESENADDAYDIAMNSHESIIITPQAREHLGFSNLPTVTDSDVTSLD
jgi:hypothetical protein